MLKEWNCFRDFDRLLDFWFLGQKFYVTYMKVISVIPQANMKHTLWITVEECDVY
jgi:hypothetical protein